MPWRQGKFKPVSIDRAPPVLLPPLQFCIQMLPECLIKQIVKVSNESDVLNRSHMLIVV